MNSDLLKATALGETHLYLFISLKCIQPYVILTFVLVEMMLLWKHLKKHFILSYDFVFIGTIFLWLRTCSYVIELVACNKFGGILQEQSWTLIFLSQKLPGDACVNI